MELKTIMKFILQKYGGKLYNAALTKLIYLLDLESVKRTGEQVSGIRWRRNHYGPFVWDVINCASRNKEFSVVVEQNSNGEKHLIHLNNSDMTENSGHIGNLIDDVKNKAPNPVTDFRAFLNYVYQTVPVQVAKKKGDLDIKAAVEAEKEVEELAAELDTPEWNEAFQYLAAH